MVKTDLAQASQTAPSAEEPSSEAKTEISIVGKRLRDVRLRQGLTVNELAARSSVSAGMISQIERGISSPSVKTLERLRLALDIALTDLFSEQDFHGPDEPESPHETQFVRRQQARPQFTVRASGLRKELLTPEGKHDLQFMIIHFEPGASSLDVLMGAGEKAGMVLAGTLELAIGEQVFTIAEGDSFQFDSALTHRVRNPGTEAAKVIWFMDTRRPKVEM